jgi:hypothetical protein
VHCFHCQHPTDMSPVVSEPWGDHSTACLPAGRLCSSPRLHSAVLDAVWCGCCYLLPADWVVNAAGGRRNPEYGTDSAVAIDPGVVNTGLANGFFAEQFGSLVPRFLRPAAEAVVRCAVPVFSLTPQVSAGFVVRAMLAGDEQVAGRFMAHGRVVQPDKVRSECGRTSVSVNCGGERVGVALWLALVVGGSSIAGQQRTTVAWHAAVEPGVGTARRHHIRLCAWQACAQQ